MNFSKKVFFKLIVTAVVIGSFAMPASAQEQKLKIGVVSIPLLLERAPQRKDAMEKIQEEFAPRQREFAAKQKTLKDKAEQAERDAAVMSESERRNMEKDLRELQRDLVRLQNELREDLNLRQNEEIGDLQRSLLKEVQAYAAQGGYDMVLGDGVLFASDAVNITAQVLAAMQANYEAGGSK